MPFTLVGNELLDNEWTRILVHRKEHWEKYTNERGYSINGTISNFFCKFNVEIATTNGTVELFGERKLVDIPNHGLHRDFYREELEIKFTPSASLHIPNTSTLQKGGLKNWTHSVLGKKTASISNELVLSFSSEIDYELIDKIGLFKLQPVYSFSSDARGIQCIYDALFTAEEDLKKIDDIIVSLSALQ